MHVLQALARHAWGTPSPMLVMAKMVRALFFRYTQFAYACAAGVDPGSAPGADEVKAASAATGGKARGGSSKRARKTSPQRVALPHWLRPCSISELQIVNTYRADQDQSKKMHIDYAPVEFRLEVLQCLDRETWLNSHTINSYLAIVQRKG
jgi:hypothetical protein